MFDCSKCGGMCCANPPLLRTFEEGMRAKKYGVEIVASGNSDDGYLIAVSKKKDVCPFLDRDTGNCKIYDERFESCRAYSCDLIGMGKKDALAEVMINPTSRLNTGLHTEKPKPLSRSQVRMIGAKIINSRNKLLQKIAATDLSTFVEMVGKTEELVKEKIDV